MQFIVTARDGAGAGERRAALRERHLARANELLAAGNLLYGVALLDEQGRACGSVMVVEFASRAELDRWLESEPFVTGKVWAEVEVRECRVGPMFAKEEEEKRDRR
jgi:uncharacterized protein YciI